MYAIPQVIELERNGQTVNRPVTVPQTFSGRRSLNEAAHKS